MYTYTTLISMSVLASTIATTYGQLEPVPDITISPIFDFCNPRIPTRCRVQCGCDGISAFDCFRQGHFDCCFSREATSYKGVPSCYYDSNLCDVTRHRHCYEKTGEMVSDPWRCVHNFQCCWEAEHKECFKPKYNCVDLPIIDIGDDPNISPDV